MEMHHLYQIVGRALFFSFSSVEPNQFRDDILANVVYSYKASKDSC